MVVTVFKVGLLGLVGIRGMLATVLIVDWVVEGKIVMVVTVLVMDRVMILRGARVATLIVDLVLSGKGVMVVIVLIVDFTGVRDMRGMGVVISMINLIRRERV